MATSDPIILLIAGSDSSGGAGLQRDLQQLSAESGIDLRSVLTAITAQSANAVHAIHYVPADIIAKQIESSTQEGEVSAVKVGMLGNALAVETVAGAIERLGSPALVVDPVLASSSGTQLLDSAGQVALLRKLSPRASLLTPNLLEAATLLGCSLASNHEEGEQQARALEAKAGCPVLLKGGHGSQSQVTDLLCAEGKLLSFSSPRLPGDRRGTGCALSSRIAYRLALGAPLSDACRLAKDDIRSLWR